VEEAGHGGIVVVGKEQRAARLLCRVRRRRDAAVRDPHGVPGPLGVRGAAPGGGGGVRVPPRGRAPDPLRRRGLRGHPPGHAGVGQEEARHAPALLLLRDRDLVQLMLAALLSE
jgi:hypothetical protein